MSNDILKLTPEHSLNEVIGLAIGRASVCWERLDGTGLFDSTTASQLVEEVTAWINTNIKKESP